MSVKVVYFVISSFVLALAARRGERCTTPNGEVAKCLAIMECSIIFNGMRSKLKEAVEFGLKSQCGKVGNVPLVCCGTLAVQTTIVPPPPCTTPNGEPASCVPISKCQLMLNALQTRDQDAKRFATNSVCPSDKEESVCCGSEAYPLRTNLLPNRTICGEQKGNIRIQGGEQTKIGEFPWMALLKYKYFNGSDAGFKCGGTVINNRYILTAAHCVSVQSDVPVYLDKVRLGEWRISTEEDCKEGLPLDCADPVIDLDIEEKIVHPQHRPTEGKNDIALLRLERNIEYTDYIQPICLPVKETPDPSTETEMHVAGWGATETSSSSDVKLKLNISIAPRSYCDRRLSSIGGVDITQVCAGGETGRDSCRGDSGGPLMRSSISENLNAKPKWYQEGIVSRGIKCGKRGFPAIYTRVAYYMDWIIENLKSF